MIPASLFAAERSPQLPLTLSLEGGELRLLSWLRTLPGKRYVAEAIWSTAAGERKVLAKIYLGARSKGKMLAERKGCSELLEAALPTPAMIASGSGSDHAWLLLEWLEDAKTLAQQLNLTVDSCEAVDAELPLSLVEATRLLIDMHSKGVLQRDLHPDNFIHSSGSWHVIDAADLVLGADSSVAEANLGLFLAQLPHVWWPKLIEIYAGGVTSVYANRVLSAARQQRLWRARDLASKSQRNCTLFKFKKAFRGWNSVWRDQAEVLEPLLDGIEEVMASAKMLKDGGSSTVVLAEWQGRPLVIKRYNVKGWGHFLRRCLRPSRASHSWRQGHIWRVLELSTARPLAVKEKRWGPFRLGGYLVTEYTPGQDIIGTFNEVSGTELYRRLGRFEILLTRMADYWLSHGDLKGTNILDSGAGLNFIDLDAAKCHKDRISWSKPFNRDLARLQRNWPSRSECGQGMVAMLSRLRKLCL